MPHDLERRAFAVDELRVERREGAAGIKLRGHAAVFNKLSEDFGGWREKIDPGAFADAISTDDVRALWNHDSNFVLGRNKSGTLTLAEDKRGLLVEIDLPDTQTIRDLVAAPIERGDVDQMSFGFSAQDQEWTGQGTDKIVRTLKKVRLFDVSPVTYAAYPQTDVAVRSLAEWRRVHDVPQRPNLLKALADQARAI